MECSLPRLAAVRAVSDPEKNADIPNNTNIAKIVSQELVSIFSITA
jgi:hypothetical protein